MNKLLISLLSLTGVAGISTGGYFLLRGNEETAPDSKIKTNTQPDARTNEQSTSNGAEAAAAPKVGGKDDSKEQAAAK